MGKRIWLIVVFFVALQQSFSQNSVENNKANSHSSHKKKKRKIIRTEDKRIIKIFDNKDIPDLYEEQFGFRPDFIRDSILYATVLRWFRTPYHYAGCSPLGIDCSDFVKILYDSTYHVHLQGGSGNLYSITQHLEKDELTEGDLVFFKIRKKRISHVGVYLCQNRFAHAARHGGVIISSLDDPYYKVRFCKGGRPKIGE